MCKYSIPKKMQYVIQMNSQEEISNVVLTEKDWKVRIAAVEKLTDETTLKAVALNDHDNDVRRAAIEKLTDETILLNILMNTDDENISISILEKLTKDRLKEIKTDNWYIRKIITNYFGIELLTNH